MTEWLWAVGIGVAATAVVALGMRLLLGFVLDRGGPAPDDPEAEPGPPLFGALTAPLAGMVPMRREAQEGMQRELLRAGLYRPTALLEYRAVRSVLTVLPLVAALLVALLWDDRNLTIDTAVAGVVLAVLGFSLPRLYVSSRGNARGREIQKGLPLALDLLALCLTAGENLVDAFTDVARQLHTTHPVLAGELALTARQGELRSLGHAVRQLAERVQVPEVTSLAFTLTQSEELGTDAARALLEMSSNLRTTMRQRAEGQASRTSLWMLFPTIFCLFVAAAIMLVGPGFLQLLREGQEALRYINETPNLIQEANRQAGQPLTVPGQPPPAQPGVSPVPGVAPSQ
jgi:tight adherence protein C